MPTATPYDERELFQQIAKGYEPAFRSIFESYKAKIYYFILHIVKSPFETEELVQDVFLRLWVSRQALAKVDTPSTYLFVMARNRALDHIQKKAADRQMKNHIAGTQEEEYNVIEEELSFKESKRILAEAISLLSPQQQKVYRLSREAGLSREEIARELNISPNTVKNHLADALQSIRDYMNGNSEIILLLLLAGFPGR